MRTHRSAKLIIIVVLLLTGVRAMPRSALAVEHDCGTKIKILQGVLGFLKRGHILVGNQDIHPSGSSEWLFRQKILIIPRNQEVDNHPAISGTSAITQSTKQRPGIKRTLSQEEEKKGSGISAPILKQQVKPSQPSGSDPSPEIIQESNFIVIIIEHVGIQDWPIESVVLVPNESDINKYAARLVLVAHLSSEARREWIRQVLFEEQVFQNLEHPKLVFGTFSFRFIGRRKTWYFVRSREHSIDLIKRLYRACALIDSDAKRHLLLILGKAAVVAKDR